MSSDGGWGAAEKNGLATTEDRAPRDEKWSPPMEERANSVWRAFLLMEDDVFRFGGGHLPMEDCVFWFGGAFIPMEDCVFWFRRAFIPMEDCFFGREIACHTCFWGYFFEK
jgi:hypothetical protein